MVALYTVFYNWTRIYKTLRTSPAQAAGLTDRLWDMADVVKLIRGRRSGSADRSTKLRHTQLGMGLTQRLCPR